MQTNVESVLYSLSLSESLTQINVESTAALTPKGVFEGLSVESPQDIVLSQAKPARIHGDLLWNTSSPDPDQWWDELCCKATSILLLQQSPATIIVLSFQKGLLGTQPVSRKIRTTNNICLFKPKIVPHSPKVLLFHWSQLNRWKFLNSWDFYSSAMVPAGE